MIKHNRKDLLSSKMSLIKEREKICPYCNHKFITSDVFGEIIKLSILKEVFSGATNKLEIKRKLKNAYATIFQHVEDLRYLGLISMKKGHSRKGKSEKRLDLTPKGKKILDDLK